MSLYNYSIESKEECILELIEKLKSNSLICGKELRDLHVMLGEKITATVIQEGINNDSILIVMMRAGIYFATGIADEIEERGFKVPMLLIDDNILSEKNKKILTGKEVIIIDAVINTGETIINVISQLPKIKNIKIVTTVIAEDSITKFNEYKLFTIRTSKNKYKGTNTIRIKDGCGPDTGDRLFNTLNI
jgi:uracil phosphoribosyltransferase